ncbi:MAG: AAA family ATPase [Candidatus Lokiarchaeota archaeon]|nr:AAA family ATPase [Candidatus Lokiarchaeota archaeon]MBD3201084.1 AAA family ATPase [Candidatus Lokiarchaeota archaeon]
MVIDLEKPWVEKYRPNSFDEIVSQNIAVNNLREFVKKSYKMPHMIFSGPAGTGKTSTALIIAKKLLKGEDFYRNVFELNASDTVRMDFVRHQLKDFVSQNMILSENTLKIVLLDEADNIPKTVQQTLRRIIEGAPSNVKFILMCNYISKIIDPIISRCAVFRFVDLPKEKIVKRLEYIATQEDLPIPPEKKDEFYETLYFISAGDLRKAINTLQMAVALELLENLDINEILKISGFIEKPILDQLVISLKEKDFHKARDLLNTIDYLDSRNFLRQIVSVLPKFEELNLIDFSQLRAYIGEIDFRISQGANENIQLSSLLAEMILRMKN